MLHRAGYYRLNAPSSRLASRPARPKYAEMSGIGESQNATTQRSGLVDEQAADVAAVEQVAVALVDFLETVAGGAQFVELEPAGPVQLEHPRYLVERVPAAEQRALDPLLHD